ncbi:MAG: MAPEG family protein [Geitlerinemataceae cyanobacterium]
MSSISSSASNILLYAVAAAAFAIYVPYLLVAYGRLISDFDLAAPRAMFDRLPPYAQRATWAHQNSFETFMPFAAAAIIAYVTGVTSPYAEYAAIAFVVARLLFSTFYVLNVPPLRSLMFGVGSASTVVLYALSFVAIS